MNTLMINQVEKHLVGHLIFKAFNVINLTKEPLLKRSIL